MKTAFLVIAMFMVFGICNITYSADNYALNFGGTKDYVKCGTNNLPEGTSERTVEAWFKTEYAGDALKQILSYGAPGTFGGMFGLMTRHRNLSFTQWGADLTGQTIISDGKWHHAAISYNGKEHTMYLDGKEETKGNPQPFNTVLNNCTIGCWYIADNNLGEFFEGTIDEARIWKFAKTQEQIKEDMMKALIGNEPDLVSYWNFNEGKGKLLADLTTSDNDGELVGAPEWLRARPLNQRK